MNCPGWVAVVAAVIAPCTSPALAGQDPPSVETGSRVRIKLARDFVIAPAESTPREELAEARRGQQLVGQIVEMDGDTLTITIQGHPTRLAVPRDAIARMDLSRGRRSAGGRLLKGAGIGLLVGGLAGAMLGLASGDQGSWFTPSERAAIGGIGFGALGFVAGAAGGLASEGEQWERVPARGVQVSVKPVARGCGLNLAVSF